jgi:hypothetical protein
MISLFSRVTLCIFIFATAVHADEIRCPAKSGNNKLSNVSIFDGPPEEKADLEPDNSKAGVSTWDVSYIFENGGKLYLQCEYSGSPKPIVVEVDKMVHVCTYKSSLMCK